MFSEYFDSFDTEYYRRFAYKIAMIFLIIGAINWLSIGAFRYNFVHKIFGSDILGRSIYVFVGLCALFVMFSRDFYLPFLGPMVAPCAAIVDRIPSGATEEVIVQAHPNAKVLYWAAEPSYEKLKVINDWKTAYGEYENTGVVTANNDGVAVLKVRLPQGYSVPFAGTLNSHVHYRVCKPSGWMGSVKTVKVGQQGGIEAFDGF